MSPFLTDLIHARAVASGKFRWRLALVSCLGSRVDYHVASLPRHAELTGIGINTYPRELLRRLGRPRGFFHGVRQHG